MATKKKFKCPKCDRSFSMAAHLARHTSTMHGMKSKKKGKPGSKKRGRPLGRPSGTTRRFGLAEMSLDELGRLIAAAKDQARQRIREFEQSIG